MTDGRADASSSWKSAGEKLSGLGSTLKAHYDKQRADDAPAKDEVSDAVKKIGGLLSDAVDAVKEAAKDPAVKGELKDVGRSLGTALSATAEQVAGEVKQAFDKHPDAQPATTQPATTQPATTQPTTPQDPPAPPRATVQDTPSAAAPPAPPATPPADTDPVI